ncbi:MAG TPA: sulfite exporter TauE/SafE family protein [Candidatus Mailhella excrementigallinarum]|nr:sulfite exporter TauE/SafE family protein [Candidatus Mailhella excrementigallinarum]
MLTSLILYCVLGALAGILAGLLGIGGGAVVVPMLVFTFKWQNLSPDIGIHLAIGTSLASIMFTAVSSAWAHHRRGGVNWQVFRYIAPGILMGTYCGSFVAARIPARYLQIFFVAFLLYVATNMLLNKKPNASRQLPGFAGMTGAGLFIGAISSLVGIGGGTLSVPFLVWHNVDMRRAVGTSAAIGFPIALAGTLGFITNGWNAPGLPEYALGFVYLPALVGIVAVSMFTAPIGAGIAHKLPIPRLKKFFACFLYVVAAKMLMDVL